MKTILQKLTSHPVFPDDDARTRTAVILSSIIINVSIILIIAALASVVFFARPLASLAIVAVMAVLVVLTRIMMMKGHPRYASVLLLSGVWVVITALVLFAGGMRSIDAVYFMVITVFAGLLLGTRGAVFYALLSAAAGAVMMVLEMNAVPLPAHFPVPPWAGWINLCLALHLIGSSLALAQKTITGALSEAKQELEVRMRTEEALRKSEARANALLGTIPDIMFHLDREGRVLDYRADKKDLYTGPGVEILGEPLGEFLSPELVERMNEAIGKTLETGEIQVFEYDLDMPGKGIRYFESRMMKCGDDEVMALIRDVTGRRLSEQRVRESLREKEVLLKEIHHRVKNNMQVISSLIALQGEQPGGAEHREVFNDIRNRVRTMALVHETLYRSENLARINLREYISSLKEHIGSSYMTGGEGVSITSRAEEISIDIDRAIPVGLIINELLTNALKYAFPAGRKGEIILECVKEGDKIRLTVSDNGVGLPPGIDLSRSDTLGLRIVNALATQLAGTITLTRGGGTAVTVVF
jgi:two-component sensor histidine kinase